MEQISLWSCSLYGLVKFSTQYFCLFGPPAVSGGVQWIRACLPFRLSIIPSFCPEVFLGLAHWFVPETQHGARVPCLYMRDGAGFFLKSLFAPKMGKMGQKEGFLNLLENLVINFSWIWTIKKFYNICYILAQIPYLGKIWFLRYWAKMLSTNQIVVFLNWQYL